MDDFAILIGGKAGEGIEKSSAILSRLLNEMGYFVYVYHDYPSIIRGGHTFSIIRASTKKIGTHREKIDFVLALNQETADLHGKDTLVIYDPTLIKASGIAIPLKKIISEEKVSDIMMNTAIVGAFCKLASIDLNLLEDILKKELPKEVDLNLKIVKRGYDSTEKKFDIKKLSKPKGALISGNVAISLGLLKAGLDAYVAYPMTPSSSILHFLASVENDFHIKVLHPEGEIGVILMALGFAAVGQKAAVGTSGGGFCLMTEGLSFAAMAEIPICIVMGQRGGPATGLPTYTAQGDLHFILHAGHGEFCRLVVAPGDAEEAYYFAALALNLAWKYQIPSIILEDKTLAEGFYTFDQESVKSVKEESIETVSGDKNYKRYKFSKNGVSPLSFPPQKGEIIKIDSYEHDEAGLTTEDSKISKLMQEKRLMKSKALLEELEKLPIVNSYGSGDVALICFGTNKLVCIEVAEELNFKVIHLPLLSPFPVNKLKETMQGVKKLICVENNATGQLADLLSCAGIKVDKKVNKYDGRPFSKEELKGEVSG